MEYPTSRYPSNGHAEQLRSPRTLPAPATQQAEGEVRVLEPPDQALRAVLEEDRHGRGVGVQQRQRAWRTLLWEVVCWCEKCFLALLEN